MGTAWPPWCFFFQAEDGIRDHLPRRGERICKIESDAGQFPTGSDPFGQIHKFSLRFFGWRKERNQSAGAEGLGAIEEGGNSEELSRVEEEVRKVRRVAIPRDAVMVVLR